MKIKYKSTREARKDIDLMKKVNLLTLFEHFPKAQKDSKWTAKELSSFLYSKYEFETVEYAKKAKNAHYAKVARLKKRVAFILTNSPQSFFVTLTFRDDVIANTNEATRREYVRKFLKAHSNGSHYLANIDYGAKNGREHYHAITNFSCSGWKYGHQLSKPIQLYAPLSAKYDNLPDEEYKQKAFETTQKRLSKYTAKLGFHAVKETTKDASLIYSRLPVEKVVEEELKPCLEELTDPAFIEYFDRSFDKQLSFDELKS